MSAAIKVLNHGLIRLVDHMGSDLSVVRAARVSYDASWRAGEDEGKDAKLLHYLIKNKHTSPLESVTFTFEVKAPIFVFRQWHRHRTWCLAGDTMLEFIRPCDGKPYKVNLASLERSWNPKTAKRRRSDQSPLSLQEHNRKRIQGMHLRCRGADGAIEETTVLDVWQSGVKKVFEVVAGGKTIRASADHKFYSDGEWVPVSQLTGRNVTILGSAGTKVTQKFPEFTAEELSSEQWAEFSEGYRVSNLGQVQSRWGQGARKPGDTWLAKTVTVSKTGRATVGVGCRPVQVSRLVAEYFVNGFYPELVVRHKDDNALDNRSCNLVCGTHQDNQDDSVRNGTRAVRAWVAYPVTSVTEVGEEATYDISVAHPEHCFVANNFLVHNCYSEVSARYSELPEEFYIPEVSQITTQSKANKQQRTDEIHPEAEKLQDTISTACDLAFGAYHSLLAAGCPRELARGVLPMNTYSHMFATVNLLNLFRFIGLRNHPHAQYEIRVYAEAMLQLIEPIVPHCVEAFKVHGL